FHFPPQRGFPMPFLTLDKLKARIPAIIAAAIRATYPLNQTYTYAVPGSGNEAAMSPAPDTDDAVWRDLRPGERWGAAPGEDLNAPPNLIDWGISLHGSTHWLRAVLQVPEAWRGKSVLLGVISERSDFHGIEATAYLDGEVFAGLDWKHRSVLLP